MPKLQGRAGPPEAGGDYRHFFENSAEGIYQTSLDGRFLDANPALARIHGYDSPKDLITDVDDVRREVYVDPERRAQFERTVSEEGFVRRFESQIRQRDGGVRWVRENAWAVRDGDGRILYFEGTIEDVTESRQALEALHRSRDELAAANQRLGENQGQLLQSERMATIGQLAAGVAHEINNPVGFLLSNLNTLDEYVQDLFELLNGYRALRDAVMAGATAEEAAQLVVRIDAKLEDMDYDFLVEDLSNLVTESRDGADRVRKIVKDLRDFSHLDHSEKMAASLNVGLESTLNIVWNELKYKAEVVREFGDIPEVECYPMEVNQVFMNLLINAAHAIEEKGTITLRTFVDGDHVCVQVADTGCGMPDDVRHRIFDPFFTTKDVGEGTGLGLSMAYNTIVDKHGGQILVDSEIGVGTTFTVRMPLTLSDESE